MCFYQKLLQNILQIFLSISSVHMFPDRVVYIGSRVLVHLAFLLVFSTIFFLYINLRKDKMVTILVLYFCPFIRRETYSPCMVILFYIINQISHYHFHRNISKEPIIIMQVVFFSPNKLHVALLFLKIKMYVFFINNAPQGEHV